MKRGPKMFRFPSGRSYKDLAELVGSNYNYIYQLATKAGYSEQEIIDWFNRPIPHKLAIQKGMRPSMVYQRMARGMTLDEALNTPVMTAKQRSRKLVRYWYNGEPVIDQLTHWSYDCFRRAVSERRWSVEKAFTYYKDKDNEKASER